MSRFSERVVRDLGQIADRATPSALPTAWDAIQSRIVEQANQPPEKVVLLDEDRPSRRPIGAWVAGAAVASLLVVVGMIAFRSLDDDSSEIATSSPELLDFEFQPIPADQYRVTSLGAPFVIDVPDGWQVQLNAFGFFVVSPEGSFGPEGQGIAMMRPSNLADPTQPGASGEVQANDWPLDDIKGWVDALVPGVVNGEPVDTNIGGLDAVRFDVTLSPEVACGNEFFGHDDPESVGQIGCIGFATNRDVRALAFYKSQNYRLWWIDGGDEAPIAISVSDGDAQRMEFFEQAEALLDTVRFESVGPNPIPSEGKLWESGIPSVVPAGAVTLPIGPGVTFNMSQPHFIDNQSDILTSVFVQIDNQIVAQTDIFFPDQAFDGEPLESVDDVVDALGRRTDLTATVVGTRTVSGFAATEVSVESQFRTGLTNSPPLRRSEQPDTGWIPHLDGTLWVVETPDGLAAITTGWSRTPAMEPAQALVTEILNSIVILPTE